VLRPVPFPEAASGTGRPIGRRERAGSAALDRVEKGASAAAGNKQLSAVSESSAAALLIFLPPSAP